MNITLKILTLLLTLTTISKSYAHDESDYEHPIYENDTEMLDESEDNLESMPDFLRGCTKANSTQLITVNQGNNLQNKFLEECENSTGNNTLCNQVRRPNPSSKSIFNCTYGQNQQHQLIHPSLNTWKNAFKAIELIDRLKNKGVCVSHIYNWWRPEPYNTNVGGAAARHPYGTSVDVRFCTNADAIKAFDTLCAYRKLGELRALGYYGSTGVHIGVGDSIANTWGRNCK